MNRCALAALLLIPQTLWAQIVGINVDRDNVAINEDVRLAIEFRTGEARGCGVRLYFGDGEVRDLRVDSAPFHTAKKFALPGRYAVRVEGKWLFEQRPLPLPTPACSGETQLMITVSDPIGERQQQVKAAELSARTQALAERERQVAARQAELTGRQQSLIERETRLRDRESELSSRQQALNGRENRMRDRELALDARERRKPPAPPPVAPAPPPPVPKADDTLDIFKRSNSGDR